MPIGGTTTILAEKYGADSTFASKCTAISTVLSLITTPLWCLVVQPSQALSRQLPQRGSPWQAGQLPTRRLRRNMA